MKQGAAAPPPGNAEGASAGAEARGAERFTLLVRAGKLVVDGREYLCVLRDASVTGVKVRMFHEVPPAAVYELELGSGLRYPMRLMWERDDHAGFRFEEEIEVQRLIDDRGEFPKRQIRVNIDKPVLLRSGSMTHVALLRNVSQSGACIECDHRLMMRELVRLEPDGMAPLFGRVVWRRNPFHGLAFERSFTLEELARHLLVIQQAEPPAVPNHHVASGGAH